MSEEEKQIFNKMIYCNLINGEQALKFNRKYKDFMIDHIFNAIMYILCVILFITMILMFIVVYKQIF